ncbi:hypothetical protein Scep_001145 [Stephania cephalantha]|uniref:adenine phosphoribosyltransferase n=1 Tax=Stephania cephalantha TaxID=152367 RepID=A0AAP0Q4S3_9MAGN
MVASSLVNRGLHVMASARLIRSFSPIRTAPSPFRPTLTPLLRTNNSRSLTNHTRLLLSSPPLLISSNTRLLSSMASADEVSDKDRRIATIASTIRVIPDFPKPGILFQDITTLLLDVKAFKDTIDLFVERYKDKDISVIAGIEARGFIFGPPIALAIGAKFVPIRKPKKLPGEVISEEYSLEYGSDIMEMHVGAVQHGERALVIDDLIATGGLWLLLSGY